MDLKFNELVTETLTRMWNLVTVIPHEREHRRDYFHFLRDKHRQELADFITKNDRFYKIFPESSEDVFVTARTNVVLLSKDEVIKALKDAYQLGLRDGCYRGPEPSFIRGNV